MYLYQFQEEEAALNTIMMASFSDYCVLHSEHGYFHVWDILALTISKSRLVFTQSDPDPVAQCSTGPACTKYWPPSSFTLLTDGGYSYSPSVWTWTTLPSSSLGTSAKLLRTMASCYHGDMEYKVVNGQDVDNVKPN